MPETKPVSLVLTSRQGTEETVQHLRGDLIRRSDTLYIRYEEPDPGPDGAKTRTMIKLSSNELKIIRHGGVEAEQTFRSGSRTPGFYRSPFTRFNLSTDTVKLESRWDGAVGQVIWEYDLYVFEELSGRFELSLHIQEDV
ncbi:DUF1934 domain-containing protein [Paenibacillus barengoltzii]|jgi:uncharacterized beta-barrel protein YwiB (DUF1934 family)|uniref:Uncharacterized beta-barrel protein YwiB, DUF1934 family n=1 Tax=Paenibacillus barengoltzii J12 TaxID=935846 RepID=A0ABY1LZW7_9BACL|nr:DUF1934 domain-containing protein [Paenibacillus barengoltzii]SMF37447.1 Uncharacterized beta-barrel protein YwiB, DUF1934 family [Paenibacillus barengoltzii]SMF43177.1 Uncharacterized beta-barrel protein YwiB, DUF1934 family [Paenibacillus barengoltzii J12]